MRTEITLQKYLKVESTPEPELTVSLAGKEVTLTQKPHVEADIKAAARILCRLQQEVTVTFASIEVDSDE